MGTTERAVIFIDGNNFYHGMKSIQLSAAELDYEKFSQKCDYIARYWLSLDRDCRRHSTGGHSKSEAEGILVGNLAYELTTETDE